MSALAKKLEEMKINLPEVATPAAAYVPYTRSGNIIFVSGQLPFADGKLVKTGHLGKNVMLEEGKQAAHACAVNILAILQQACGGSLDKVKRALKLEILVACTPDFTEPHLVANGASELILSLFGDEKGKHARVAYGVSVLPLNAAVEVAATFEVE